MRPGPGRLIVRTAAVAVLLLGVTRVVLAAVADISSAYRAATNKDPLAPGPQIPDPWTFLRAQHPAVVLCLVGGIAYVLSEMRLPRGKRRRARGPAADPGGPFDFEAAFGRYVLYESARRRLLRWALGALCLLVGLGAGAWGNGVQRRVAMFGPFVLVLGQVGVVVGVLLILSGLRLFARRGESVLRRNRRRPVLYLRSFAADVRLFGGVGDFFRLLLLGGVEESAERRLARAVADVGPLVAIGQPGERLPPLGGARLYVRGDEDWRRVVGELVQASQLVIFRIGRTSGFDWELRHVLSACDPRKVLFYLPPRDRENVWAPGVYAPFRRRTADLFPCPLPLDTGAAAFLGFGPGWVARPRGAEGGSFASDFRWFLGGSAPAVREALNEALRRLGVKTRPLPMQPREWLAVLVYVLLFFQCFPCCVGSLLPRGMP
jgi:hypothetical protein